MFKKILLLVCFGVFFFGAKGLTYSQDEQTDAMTHATHQKVEVGNKICPVSGEEVGQSGMEPVTYEYEGKIYNFCCLACVDEFKKDPEKYIKIVGEEMKNNAAHSGHSH